ncbi:MAG: laccase domain-containing protein [Desulfobacterales bacterium]|nr:laccase domain-containing protein [Desulfobacterales bacterium]
MIETQVNGVPVLRFSHLSAVPGVCHGIFTRHGGVSQGPFQSLNMAFGVGDQPDAVLENRRILADCMGGAEPVFLDQVHGTRVRRIASDSPTSGSGVSLTGDAMVTARAGTALTIQTADCQAILLFDPQRRVVANVHSGWRGSVANVIGQTLAAMTDAFGCRPKGVLAGIGPSLGPCCAEFRHYRREIPEPLWGYGDSRHHFDFWALSRDQLVGAGVAEANVEAAGICTRCRTDRFFSYRAEGVTGRLAAAIALTDGVR